MAALIALTGPPAVGKSTLARALADRYDASVFDLGEAARRLREGDEYVRPAPAGRSGPARPVR